MRVCLIQSWVQSMLDTPLKYKLNQTSGRPVRLARNAVRPVLPLFEQREKSGKRKRQPPFEWIPNARVPSLMVLSRFGRAFVPWIEVESGLCGAARILSRQCPVTVSCGAEHRKDRQLDLSPAQQSAGAPGPHLAHVLTSVHTYACAHAYVWGFSLGLVLVTWHQKPGVKT